MLRVDNEIILNLNRNRNNMAQIQIHHLLPKKYSGDDSNETARSHILQYEDYITFQNLDPAVQADNAPIMNRFKLTLKGKARSWVDGKVFANFAELKDQFIRKFGGAHSREGAVEKFNACAYVFPEPVEDYLLRIKEWAQILNYGDELIRDRFLAGLPDDLRGMAHMSNIANIDDLVKAVQNYVTSKSKSTTPAVASSFLTQNDTYEQRFDKIEEKLETLCLAQNSNKNNSADRGRQKERQNWPNSRYNRSNSRENYNRQNSRERNYSNERRRRNYSRERRDYSRERRDYSRERRDYSRERKRNYPRDYSRDKRDYSNERFNRNRDYSKERYKSKYASTPTVSFEEEDF